MPKTDKWEQRRQELDRFGAELDAGETELSRIISIEAITASRDRIAQAMEDAIVNNGHGVRIKS